MYLIKAAVLTCFLTASASVFAGGCEVMGAQLGDVYNGKTSCTSASLNSLTINGAANIQSTVVKGNAMLRGPVQATDFSVMGNLIVSGPLMAQSLKVESRLTVRGPAHIQMAKLNDVAISGLLLFTDVMVEGSMSYAADKAWFSHSTLSAITVHSSSNESPVLCLTNKTHVKGAVTFVNGSGTVYASGDSMVDIGVVGGSLKQGPCPES